MNEFERYQFDLNGYIIVKNILSDDEVRRYLAVVEAKEEHFRKTIDDEPRMVGFANIPYRFDEENQCFAYKHTGAGIQLVIDDFLNISPEFDSLVGHERTMAYVDELCVGPNWIGSSEIRYRFKANETHTHMGGHMDMRNRYQFAGVKMYDSAASVWRVRDFDLAAVRILYALHDVPEDYGPLCVVPGSHKSNYFSPYKDQEPTAEPGMVPLTLKAGDAIIFTENLRHGGFPNLRDTSRKTLHIMFSPRWAASQSPLHWNDRVYVSPQAWARYSEAQRAVLPAPAQAFEQEAKVQRQQLDSQKKQIAAQQHEIAMLKGEIQALKNEVAAAKGAAANGAASNRSLLGKIMGR